MAITNYERVGKAMTLLRDGLAPFVQRECQNKMGKYWITQCTSHWQHDLNWPEGAELPDMDAALLLRVMWEQWNRVFAETLGHAERSLVSELRDVRNDWAHQKSFSSDDTDRALDSTYRLLTAISAPEADEVNRMKQELRRLVYEEQTRTEQRRVSRAPIESQVNGGIRPWREVVTPHPDVASGRFVQAEFAADLWEVHLGEAADEYQKPVPFFERTFLTNSLRHLLANAVRRLRDGDGDPVVQLQTNFGGGKTHSMLALYHLFSGVQPISLPGIEDMLKAEGVEGALPAVKRVVLVANKLSPGRPTIKEDGTEVRTLWGELAWQLGGRKAYDVIRADDENATSPGDALRVLMNKYGPCLILIDEWVAYARQLHDAPDLPGGSFETHFSFAQALTEAARGAKRCLLVISLPASDTTGSPHTRADDAEVGGERGRAALDRLKNAIGRVETSWTPASSEEGFEIVRRRLFQPLEQGRYVLRDLTARRFYDLYRGEHQTEFPPECRNSDYEGRIKAAYPIHPEVFDRLYTDWSTLLKFQRTRGVLRLMAAVIHSLWASGDRNPLIMPANIPLDDPRVRTELQRYLSDNWAGVIDKDIDGPNALPLRIDADVPNLGKYSACRRVARTIHLGSAPTLTAANRGLEDRQVKLGCAMPGESPHIFGDALRRLSAAATFLYHDGARYWYSTQPTVTKLAEDRAEQFKRDPDAVAKEIERRVRAEAQQRGEFARVHPWVRSGSEVPDDADARLVVLTTEAPCAKDDPDPARSVAQEIWEQRGAGPRICRNTLSFLAADKHRLQDLDEAVGKYLAWNSIVAEKELLNLTDQQTKQARAQCEAADDTVNQRLPECYVWLLVPRQRKPQLPLEWEMYRLSGREGLAVRASKKLLNEDLLVTTLAHAVLRRELDGVPLWRGDHVSLRQLAEDFARYPYLPRLKNTAVLWSAVERGVESLTWEVESFAYADGYDEGAQRYTGLRAGRHTAINDGTASALLVRAEVAARQLEKEAVPSAPQARPQAPVGAEQGTGPATGPGAAPQPTVQAPEPAVARRPRRFHGAITLDPLRIVGRAGMVAEEVVAHLKGLPDARVTVTLEIHADVPGGVSEQVMRIVTENCRTLGFEVQGFEEE